MAEQGTLSGVSTSFDRYLASITESFPSLRGAPVKPWEYEVFQSWAATLPEKSSAWWAARFVLAFRTARLRGWVRSRRPQDAIVRYGFDIFEAQVAWTLGDCRAAAVWLLTSGKSERANELIELECRCDPPLRVTTERVRLGWSPILCRQCECPFAPTTDD